MTDWAKLAPQGLEIERYELERRTVDVSSDFSRVTTTIVLHGRRESGRGEDVTYTAADHDGFPAALPLAGRHTLASFSALLDEQSLFAGEPEMHASLDYRRWGFESAALDLALRQAGSSFADVVGREPRPVRFVVSSRNPEPWLELYPGMEVKLDPTSEWTREHMQSLSTKAAIRVLDLKAYYRGTGVDQPPDPRLYRDVVEVFPDAVVEDAAWEDDTREILEPVRERLSFDAPIHSVADVEALPFEPRWLNIKPSRFGTLERLLDCIAWCEERSVRMYGGGQFELGVGRGHIQKLASLYYADQPNDVAPGEYNAQPRAGLPTSPLRPSTGPGF